MRKDLYLIKGNKIETLPFKYQFVGDIIYFGWPLLSIYAEVNTNAPIIKAWVDASVYYERYLIFKTTEKALEGYLLRQIPYLELIRSTTSGLYYVTDISKKTGEEEILTEIKFEGLNKKYIPDANVKFDFPTDEVDQVVEHFKLNTDVNRYLYGDTDIEEKVSQQGTEIIRMRLHSTNGIVGDGEIQSNVLGEALLSYNKMAEAVALKLHEEKRKKVTSNQLWGLGERDNVIKLARTKFYAMTGSFDVFLTPVKNRDEEGGTTSTENITNRIFDLFDMEDNLAFTNKSKNDFPQEMLSAYETFLGVIQRNGIRIAMQYGNQKYKLQKTFDYLSSARIIKQLRSIEEGKPTERKFTGRFNAFDEEKFKFRFITNNGHSINGTFTEKTAEGINPLLNFHGVFNIVVSTSYEQRSGKQGTVERNVLISCYKD